MILSFYVRTNLLEGASPSARRTSDALKIHIDQIYDQILLIEKKGWIAKIPKIRGGVKISAQAFRKVTGKSPQRLKSKLAREEALR